LISVDQALLRTVTTPVYTTMIVVGCLVPAVYLPVIIPIHCCYHTFLSPFTCGMYVVVEPNRGVMCRITHKTGICWNDLEKGVSHFYFSPLAPPSRV
jgi:hypothetical protein